MTYTSSARQPEPELHPTWTRGAEHLSGGQESTAANDSNVVPITAAHTARHGPPGTLTPFSFPLKRQRRGRSPLPRPGRCGPMCCGCWDACG